MNIKACARAWSQGPFEVALRRVVLLATKVDPTIRELASHAGGVRPWLGKSGQLPAFPLCRDPGNAVVYNRVVDHLTAGSTLPDTPG